MKICIISDSHGKRDYVNYLVCDNDFDKVFFLGDGLRDIDNENEEKVVKVAGNNDYFNFYTPLNETVKIGNKKIFLTHGHNFNVRQGIYQLEKEAKQFNYDIVCFGHTHSVHNEFKDGVYYLNPGSLFNGRFMVLDIDGDKITVTEHKL